MAEVEWIEDVDALAALAPEWDALLSRSGVDDPYLTSDFLLAWWRHFGARRAPWIAAVRAVGVLWGGLPLYAERVRGRVWLRFPGAQDHALAQRTSLLRPEGSTGALEAITRALAARDDWDVLELARVPGPPAEVEELIEVFERRGHRLRRRRTLRRFRIDVPADPEAYLSGASKNFRRKLARARRAAETRGGLELVLRSGADEVSAALDQAVAFTRASAGASPLDDPRLVAFYAELLPRFEERGWLRAHALELEGESVAIGFGYSLRGELNERLAACDAARAELEPADLMTWELLSLASRRSASVLDLGTREGPHELRWATSTEPVSGLVFERSFARRST